MSDIVDIPDSLAPTRMRLGLLTHSALRPGLLVPRDRVIRRPGKRWTVELSWARQDDDAFSETLALLAQAPGGTGMLRVPNFARPAPLGPATGSPVVDGDNQIGGFLRVRGFAAETAVLYAGTYFSIGSEFKILLTDALTDAQGHVTLEFTPRLRHSPADGEALVLTRPTCVYRVMDMETRAGFQSDRLVGVTVRGIEEPQAGV